MLLRSESSRVDTVCNPTLARESRACPQSPSSGVHRSSAGAEGQLMQRQTCPKGLKFSPLFCWPPWLKHKSLSFKGNNAQAVTLNICSHSHFLPLSFNNHKKIFLSPLFSRSTDYGTTYEKLNDKVGLKTVLSYLYVSPTNKRKVRESYRAGSYRNKITAFCSFWEELTILQWNPLVLHESLNLLAKLHSCNAMESSRTMPGLLVMGWSA